MEFVAEDGKSPHASCSTLILPALSIGNVGQLAVDLLVSSTNAERIGYLDDPNLLPCVGNDAYRPSPPGNLALPLEVFDSPANGNTFVQQRSPVVRGMMVDFARNLANFAASSGKKHVVLLSGLEFGRWRNIDMSGYFTCLAPTPMDQMLIASNLGGRGCKNINKISTQTLLMWDFNWEMRPSMALALLLKASLLRSTPSGRTPNHKPLL